MQLVCDNLEQVTSLAKKILVSFPKHKKFLFYGDLGVGKTTLIKELSLQLGVLDVVSSPTFSIINEYNTLNNGKIYHFDFYRLRNEQEAFDIGCEEYFLQDTYCFVEWPNKVPSLITNEMVKVRLDVESKKRLIEIII